MTHTQPFAGFEFSQDQVLAFLAITSLIALSCILYASLFMAYLVKGAQQLHQRGVLGHPMIVVAVAMGSLVAAFEYRDSIAAPILLTAGLGIGYAVMLCAGTSWFRWTAAPSAAIVFLLAGVR